MDFKEEEKNTFLTKVGRIQNMNQIPFHLYNSKMKTLMEYFCVFFLEARV
jgi:hypothetical protein